MYFEGKPVDPIEVQKHNFDYNSISIGIIGIWKYGSDISQFRESGPLCINYYNTFDDEDGQPVFVTKQFDAELIFELDDDGKPLVRYESPRMGEIQIVIANPHILMTYYTDKTTIGVGLPFDKNTYYPRGPFVFKVFDGQNVITTRPFQVRKIDDERYDIDVVRADFPLEPTPCEEVISAVDHYLDTVNMIFAYEGYAEDYTQLVRRYPNYCGYIKDRVLKASTKRGLRIYIDDYMRPIIVTKFAHN